MTMSWETTSLVIQGPMLIKPYSETLSLSQPGKGGGALWGGRYKMADITSVWTSLSRMVTQPYLAAWEAAIWSFPQSTPTPHL